MQSIRAKLILAVVVMAALLGVLAVLVAGQLNTLGSDLTALHDLQDVKSHVLIPQKDMNATIGFIGSTLQWLELGNATAAQEVYDETVDAEQDISKEFEYLEQHAQGEVVPIVQQAHTDWEAATEFMKIQVETTAKSKGMVLVRPSTEPTKVIDKHATDAIAAAQAKYGSLDATALAAIADDNKVSPVETADVSIDGAAEKVDEILAAYQERGDASLAKTQQLTLFGLIAALVGVVFVGLIATASIVRPLDKLKVGAQKVAAGDLDYDFGATSNDEVGAVTKAVQEMAHSLKDRIRNMEEVAGIVVLTSEEISASAKSGTEADIAKITEKADMMRDLVGQVLPK